MEVEEIEVENNPVESIQQRRPSGGAELSCCRGS